jgi:hypothetical protein
MPESPEPKHYRPAPGSGDDDDDKKDKEGKGPAAVAMASATRSLLHALPRHLMKDTMKKNAFLAIGRRTNSIVSSTSSSPSISKLPTTYSEHALGTYGL